MRRVINALYKSNLSALLVLFLIAVNTSFIVNAEHIRNHSRLFDLVIGERDVDLLLSEAKRLIEQGENINFIHTSKTGMESSVLSQAVDRQIYDLVKLLIDSGANINPIHQLGCTPIGVSITYQDQAITRLLIDKGANLDAPTCYRPDKSSHSAIRALLTSRMPIEDSLRIYAIEKHAEAGRKLDRYLLKAMIREEKHEVVKRIIELQPSIFDENMKKRALASRSEEIRSLAVDTLIR